MEGLHYRISQRIHSFSVYFLLSMVEGLCVWKACIVGYHNEFTPSVSIFSSLWWRDCVCGGLAL